MDVGDQELVAFLDLQLLDHVGQREGDVADEVPIVIPGVVEGSVKHLDENLGCHEKSPSSRVMALREGSDMKARRNSSSRSSSGSWSASIRSGSSSAGFRWSGSI